MDLRQRVSRARFEDLCGDLWAEIDATLDKVYTLFPSFFDDVFT